MPSAAVRQRTAALTVMVFALSMVLGVAGCAPAETATSAAAEPQTEASDAASGANDDAEEKTRSTVDADAPSTQLVDLGDLTIQMPGSFQCLSDGDGSGYVQWAESTQIQQGDNIADYIAFLPGEYPDDFETYTESAYRGLYQSASKFPEGLGLEGAQPGEVEGAVIGDHPVYLVRGTWGSDKGFLLFVIPFDDHYAILLLSASLENVARLAEIAGTIEISAELSTLNQLYFIDQTLSDEQRESLASKFQAETADRSSSSGSSSKGSSSSSSTATRSQSNALQQAHSYLNVMAFSYEGLIEQLEYEGYSHSDAVYAADNCGADWYEQAAKKAQEYEDVMAFSHSGLVDQLEYEGFTHAQAEHGVNAIGL